MVLYAIERIDDAVDMTRSFLLPVDAGRWARLTVIIAFVLGGTAGGGGTFSAFGNAPAGAGTMPGGDVPEVTFEWPTLPADAIAIVLGAAAVLLVAGVVVAAIGAIMEFVFVESLSTDEVHVRRYARRYARKGLRLFAFRVLLGIGTILVLGGTTALLFGDILAAVLAGNPTMPSAGRLLVGGLVLVPLGIAVGLAVALANGFTTEFVVPIMLREDRGVIAAWRHFWPTMTGQWKQYGTYVLLAFGLHIVTNIAGGIAVGIAAVALAVPVAVVAVPLGLGALQGGTLTVGAVAVLVVLLAIYLLLVVLAAAVVYVPINVFHRQFALLVLGDTNEAFDVLGDRRPEPAE